MKARIIQPPYSRDVSLSDEYFEYKILVQPSKAFFGWLFSFDTQDIKLIAPQCLVDKYKEFLRDRLRGYED